ncbi:MAG: hypothetical protein KA715_07175 [Xanthomonadaceae bacterium]|nr:hypothetical protein [Xanthomonadaceae bacterium]
MSTILLTTNLFAAVEPKDPNKKAPCLASKEYIAVLSFLRSEKSFQVTESDAQRISDQVSSGCENAAKNFTQSVLVMVEAGIPTRDAIKTATELSSYDSAIRNHFLEIFYIAFSEDQLALDVGTSLSLAKSLSIQFKGDTSRGVNDFKQALMYCLDQTGLNLPRPECARIAQRVAQAGERFDQESFSNFKKLDEFIRGNKMDLSISKSTDLALEILALAPAATENFITAFKFSTSDGGLKLPLDGALSFSKKLASK